MTHWTQEQYDAYIISLAPSAPNPADLTVKEVGDEGPESKLQAKIQKWAKENGFPCWHDRSRGKNQRGWPDLVLCFPKGVVLFLELKSKSGRLSKEQKQMKLKFLFLGHNWYEVRSYKQFLNIINTTGEPI